MFPEREDCLTQVLLENRRRERVLSEHACKSRRGSRKHPASEEIPDSRNIRPIFAHDADRIIHSLAYARYIDKTQVFYLMENDHITHRVLHVQFVSKIGRTIGRALRLNEDLIEAIALGHDLGHIPYGHDGEGVLDRLCREHGIGSFSHNVQSARWLMELERGGLGLNLSLQVLDGILAHNGEIVEQEYTPQYGKTWAQFEEEYEDCMRDNESGRRLVPMTLEGCVVRISDVIAYIGRDIEDAITIGLIHRADIPSDVVKVLGDTNRQIIDRLAMDLIVNSYGKEYLRLSPNVFRALDDLKAFNYQSIYLDPRVCGELNKIEHMFEQMFRAYLRDLEENSSDSSIHREFVNLMDKRYQHETEAARIVADYIAGMTDRFFNNQYRTLFLPRSLGYTVEDDTHQ